jgi:hypothetical protein
MDAPKAKKEASKIKTEDVVVAQNFHIIIL